MVLLMKLTALTLALYLLLGSLMPGADYGQWGKWADALEHYQLHQQLAAEQGQELSFHDFLLEHFWNTDSHDHGDGGQSHQDLPLKHLHSFDHIVLQFFKPFIQLPPVVAKQVVPLALTHVSALYKNLVFRPPIA